MGGAASSTRGGSSSGGSDNSGGDSDQIYIEVMRRVREEQEQIGQVIDHPF
jgi:hypothetical protein